MSDRSVAHTGVRFGVLGPLEVTRNGVEIVLGSKIQRSVLGVLLASRGRVVSTDRLIDDVWGDDGAPDRQNALWVHISNLRKRLEPDRAARTDSILVTRAPGYLLDPAPGQLDAVEFEHLVSEGRALLDPDPGAASIVLAEALALWRGRAYADFAYDSWAQPEIDRLEELRLEAVENRIDADLRRGLARELVGELEALVHQHPMREQLTASLMLALYRSGRQAEALRAFQLHRGHLGDELGIEPTLALRRLEEQIITNDPALDHGGSAPGREPGLSIRGYEMREKLGERGSGVVYTAYQPAIGREVAVKVIRPDLADDASFIQRFEAEAQLVAQLEHPHILPLYDYWREPGAAYLVMRYMAAGTLRDLLREGPLAPDQLARIVDQVGAALETAHRAGIAHGCVEPQNILIDADGNAYLADFEIATLDRVPAAGADTLAGPMASDLRSFAATVAQAAAGRADPVPEVLVGLAAPILAVVQEATAGDLVDLGEFRRAFAEAMQVTDAVSTPLVDENPYKGLRSFEQSDARDFFGRERFIARLVNRLGRSGVAGRFVAVVGPSGSGKSSVVKAGLLPAIREGAAPGSASWFIVELTPGLYPFEALESALMTVAVNPPTSLLQELTGKRGIERAIDRVLPDLDAQLVLLIDQFEELYTLAAPDAADRFVRALASAVRNEHSRLKVVTTLRADFYDHPLRHPIGGDLFRIGTEVLTPLAPDELERAITGPAARVGATCEPGLVGEMIAAVGDQPGALPLLQYALTELFEHRDGPLLRISTYRELGGVSGAVVDRAEAIHADMDSPSRAATREVFLRLVTLGEGTGDTRRRVLLSELTSIGKAGHRYQLVVETFGRHRLLSFDRDPVTRAPTVEISHEALLSAWDRLRGWVDDARSDVAAQRRLAEATQEWLHRERDPDYLMAGGRLARYDDWLTSPPVGLTPAEREFLGASQEVENERRLEEAAQQRRADQLRIRSRILVGLGFLTLAVIALGVYALVQQRRASDLANEIARSEEARRLAAEAQVLVESDPDLALVAAVEAARATEPDGVVLPEVMDALHVGIQATRAPYPVADGPIALRRAVGGGVYLLAPTDLVALAQSQIETASIDATRCAAVLLRSCGDVREPLTASLAIAGGDDAYAGAASDQALAGTTVRIVAPFVGPEQDAFEGLFVRLEEQTGIDVLISGQRSDQLAVDAVRDPGGFDLVVLPQPGPLEDLALDHLVDVSAYIERAELEARWGPYLTSLVSVDSDGTWPSARGGIYGVWTKLDAKSLIWHSPAAFAEAGLEPPSAWGELTALTRDMLDTGVAPWCLGLSSGDGASDGWSATDLLESVVLRSAGPELYDAWARHDVPFDHPDVLAAAQLVETMLFTPGHLFDGPASATRRGFWEGPLGVAESPPRCWMAPFASFASGLLDDSGAITPFRFPVLDPANEDAMVGAGVFIGAVADRPEVRAVMEHLTSAAFLEATAEAGTGWIPPNLDFDVGAIPDPVEQGVARLVYAALADDTFRFDASDLMPAPIGTTAFWGAMVDWFRGGAAARDEVFASVEETWLDLEAGAG